MIGTGNARNDFLISPVDMRPTRRAVCALGVRMYPSEQKRQKSACSSEQELTDP